MSTTTRHPTPYKTRSGLSSVAVGRIRKLRARGYNAREIVSLTKYEPADVRRVLYQDASRGEEFQSLGDAAKEMIADGFDERVVKACFGV